MAELPELETALRNADAAGDVDAARQLAAEISRKRDIGQGRAAVEGWKSGVSAGWSDEVRGMANVPGVPKWLGGFGAIPGGAMLAHERLTQGPGGPLEQAYKKERDIGQQNLKTAQEQYPITTGASEIAGGVTAPGTRILQAPTLGARVGRGIAYGAGYGTVSGAGHAEEGQRIPGAIAGGVVGGVIGGVAPPVIEGALQVGRAVGAPLINAWRGVRDPTGEAGRRIGRALEEDIRVDPAATARLTPGEYAATPEARLIDTGGETTRAVARSAANTSPQGRHMLNELVTPRYEAQSPRVGDFLNTTLTYPTQQTQRDAIRHVRENVYEPRYAQAYRDARNTPLWNRDLEELAQAPEMQAAIRLAIPNLRNWAVRDGLPPPRGAFTINTSGPVPRTELIQTPTGHYLPSLQLWDYVKRALDKMETPTARQFARTLRDQLDTMVPAYRTARESAQPTRFFEGARDAFEAGQNYLNRGQHFGPDAQRHLARMTTEERNLFRDGYTSALVQRLEKIGDRRNALNTIASTPAARAEIEAAIGPQNWRCLEATLRIEGIMDFARTAVQGNSTSVRQWIEAGLAGGAGGAQYLATGDPNAAFTAAMVYGILRTQRAAGHAIDTRVAERVAQLLTSRDPRVLERGVQLVARQNRLMDALRTIDQRIAASGTTQARDVPRMLAPGQGAVPAGAEQEQR